MRITGLKPVGRRPGFVSIDVGGVRMGMLPVEEIRALGVAVGQELDGRGEERLLTALERVTAYDAAVRLLAVRGRSVQEMISRLRRKGLRPDAVEHAVGRLESEGLLDDAAFAREFARSLAGRGYGRARILADLSAKGVARLVAERVVADVGEDDEEARREMLLALARKRAGRLRGLDRAVAQRRLVGYLARRGYQGGEAWDVVKSVLDEIGEGE
jgi:regulatory protein